MLEPRRSGESPARTGTIRFPGRSLDTNFSTRATQLRDMYADSSLGSTNSSPSDNSSFETPIRPASHMDSRSQVPPSRILQESPSIQMNRAKVSGANRGSSLMAASPVPSRPVNVPQPSRSNTQPQPTPSRLAAPIVLGPPVIAPPVIARSSQGQSSQPARPVRTYASPPTTQQPTRSNSSSSSMNPPPPPVAGVAQRQSGHQLQKMLATANNNAKDISDHTRTLALHAQQIQEQGKASTGLEKIVEELRQQMNRLAQEHVNVKAQLADLQERVESGAVGCQVDVDEGLTKVVSVVVRAAASVAYGCTPPKAYPAEEEEWPRVEAADGSLGELAMRWDLDQHFTSDRNTVQTNKLLTILKYQIGNLPLTADIPRESVPPYLDNANLYNNAISVLFRQYQAAMKKKKASEARTRQMELAEEIAEMEEQGASEAEIQAKKDELEEMNKGQGVPRKYLKGNVKSKANTVQRWISARRPLTEYKGPEYDCLDSVFCTVPLYCVNPDVEDEGKIWCWPDMQGVYSEQFIKAWRTIYFLRHSTLGKGGGVQASPEPPGGAVRQKAIPLFPSRYVDLHTGPQEWMFAQSWLEDEDNADQVDMLVVPATQPTSVQEVLTSNWYATHAWVTKSKARTGASAKTGATTKKQTKGAGSSGGKGRTKSTTPAAMAASSSGVDANRQRGIRGESIPGNFDGGRMHTGSMSPVPASQPTHFNTRNIPGLSVTNRMQKSPSCDGLSPVGDARSPTDRHQDENHNQFQGFRMDIDPPAAIRTYYEDFTSPDESQGAGYTHMGGMPGNEDLEMTPEELRQAMAAYPDLFTDINN